MSSGTGAESRLCWCSADRCDNTLVQHMLCGAKTHCFCDAMHALLCHLFDRVYVCSCPLLQGMGNLVNGCVILICMGMFNMTGVCMRCGGGVQIYCVA
jgi:hypothetical protein